MPFLLIFALFAIGPVQMSVYPSADVAPATIRLRAIIERHQGNRRLCLGYDGPQLKNFCYQIDGAQSERVFEQVWPFRIGGEYEAKAELTRIEGGKQRSYASVAHFRVLGISY